MINKKRITLSIFCLLLLVFSVFMFYACKNEIENFNLSFKVNGETYQTITTSGEEAITIPENPTKEGYTFDGWYWDKDVWSKPFTANSLLDAPISSDMSVYAKFNANKYDITYENDGGTHNNPISYTVEDGFALSAAEKTGYTFVGWYSNSAYTTKVEAISVGSTGAITLYAKFEINNYTVSYGNTKGSVNNNVTSYNVNTDTITLSKLSKTGYTFEGWYNGEQKVTKIVKGSTGDITLTAKWSVIGYEFTYHNVAGATNSNPATYDVEDQPLVLVDASKTGYRFLGWYTDAAFTNNVNKIAIGTIGDIDLYAKWEAIEYTATFKDGDTEVGKVKFTVETESITEPDVPDHLGYTGVWESYILGTEDITVKAVYTLVPYDITYNNVSGATNTNPTTYDVEDQPLALVDASKDHYTFLGWYSDENLTTKVTEIAVGTTGTVELYAKWEAIEYTATFKDGDTEVEKVKFTVESEDITEPAVPNHVGYTGTWASYTLGTEDIVVKAVYTLIPYDITYNNVSDATHTNPATYDVEDQPLTLADASKIGYRFLGWYSDIGFTNKITEIAVETTGSVELYAKWETIEYTITFLYDNAIGDYAEGTVVKTTYTVEDEFEFVALVCKTVGYTFDGWYTEKNVGTGTKVVGVVKGTTDDITVYAQFGLEEYDITYNNVNGATNNNPTHYNAASDDFTIYPLTKEGYTFDGWFTNEECTTPANLIITKGSNGDITLYAKWTPITYTIEYVTYGGAATGNPTTYIVTDNITLNNATFSGYVFKGWYTAAEGGSKVTGITAGTTGNIILYAHWDYVSTITFESNGGSPVNSISNVEGTAISAPVAPTKEHYTFAGWYSDAALKNAYSFATQPAEDITLYAKWTPVVYEIEYVLNGGTNSENNVVEYTVEDKIEIYAPSKAGYTFIGWFTDAEFTSSVVTELKVGTSGKITLYAHYSINKYTISFESNGGTSVSAITQNYATSVTAPESPSKNGYTFAGWYSNASLTSRYTFSTMPADNITLYAKWDLANYNITYNLNGGTNNSGNPATYTITSATITLKAPTKTGYSFAGWFTNAECTEAISEIASGSYGVVELFAKWTATEYTITYATADGATHSNILTYTIETDLTTLADATLKGHAFGGWYTDDSYVTAVTTIAGGEIGNKTVYAKFTANTYNVWLDGNEEASRVVSFNLNGAEGVVASQTVTPTATLKYPTVPTRDGYIFAGWYDNENCTGSLYDFTAVVTSDTTLYAKWVKVESATATAINGSSNVTLNGKYEQMLMFVPLVSGNITITASGNYDTFGVLYNSEMVALAQDDDNASDGKNFLIVYNVTAGETYYIGTRAFSSTTTGTATVSIAGSTTVLDGGYAITASKTTATYGQNFTLNVPNARDGYKFLGYADENGVMYTDATGASVRTWDKDSETTLYSKWERTVYTVTFVTSGGTPINSIELAYGERLNIGQYVTTRSGYSFNGWYLDGEAFNATTMPDHNITLTAYWKTFALGTIKYDVDKIAVSVDDEITADLFSAMCLDTNGNLATFTVTVSGTQAAGETISVRLVAKSGNKTKQITISDIKVYSTPTLTFDDTVDYFNIKDGLTAEWFTASGTDSFGNATSIRVYVDYDYESGDYVTITIASIDPAGNITYGYIEDVKAYGLPDIIYNEEKTGISVNDVLNAELFGASATDSFGEELTVTVSKYSGTISAGNTVIIRISATDSKGNTKNIDVSCKVYGAPAISNATKTDVKASDTVTPELLGITATDTYGETLNVALTVKEGNQTAGATMTVTAIATDVAGNVTTKDYTLKVYGTPTISYDREGVKVSEDATLEYLIVRFDLNGGNGNITNQVISSFEELVYPKIPTRSGYVFKGWYTTPDCTTLFDFSADITQNITVYAGWHQISTSGYGNYVMNIYGDNNSSSDYYSVSTQGTSSSSAKYTYFTVLKDGTYKLYYKNGSSSTNYRTYMYVYNATQGTAIKSNGYISSTSYSYVSFTAKAGDVIYVRNYRYSTSSSSYYTTFYMYLTGADTPEAGGKMPATAAQTVLNATATDSFGNPLTVTAAVKSGNLTVGTNIVYTLTATDHLGNTHSIDTAPIGVYDVNDINLTYSAGMSDLIKLTSKGEEFDAKATDSFGSLCDISIEAAEGYTLAGGNTISLYIVATDKAGNKVYSDIINGSKVYDMPTATLDEIICEDTVIDFIAIVKDSFGEELYTEITWTGTKKAGENVYVTVKAEDDAGNVLENTYTYCVAPAGHVYTLKSDGTYEFTSYTGSNSNVDVWSIINGKSVTAIAANAFKNNTYISSVTIPNSVTSIGLGVFEGCTSLESVTLPFVGATKDGTSNTHFGYVFGASSYSYNDAYVPSRLKTVVITGGTSIGEYAFHNCGSLMSISIPSSVTSIGGFAFRYCTSLESITLPFVGATKDGTSNTHFGYVFGASSYSYNDTYVPSRLKTVVITGGASIGSSAFYSCDSLTSVTIGNGVTSIGSSAFRYCDSLTSVVIGNSVTSIGSYAFYDCDSLTSVVIGNSVKTIGSDAFSYCSSLTSVNITDIASWCGISFDGYYANPVYYAENLYIKGELVTNLVIPDTVTSIKDYAFYGCDSLTSVTIPNSVTSIGSYAFRYCYSLTSVTIPNSVKTIGDSAFEDCSRLTSVVIGNSVKTIGSYAFEDCDSLTSVVIGNSVTSIGSYAFYDCDSLTSVTIPNSVTSISSSAFYRCTSLTSVVIPSSVTSIGSEAFNGCYKLVEVINKSSLNITKGSSDNGYVGYNALEIHRGESKIVNKDGYLFITSGGVNYLLGYAGTDTALTLPSDFNGQKYEIYQYAFYNNDKITSVIISDSVTTIGNSAFYNCDSLTSVTIPNSVKTIGNSAFYNCDSLTSVVIPSSVTSIGNSAFYGCDSLTSVTIPNSVKTIGNSAFRYCYSLTSVTIPNSVTSIGYGAFSDCNKLVEVINKSSLNITKGSEDNGYVGYYALEIHRGESKIVNKDGYLFITSGGVNYLLGYAGTDTALTLPNDYNGQKYQIYKYAFCYNDKITSVVIPDSVTSIGSSAFYDCDSLTSVEIPNSVTSIGSYAFYNCGSLTSVTIGNSVTSIGGSAFQSCNSLTSVTIGSGVTSIGDSAFSSCTSLTSIKYRGTQTQWNAITKGSSWDSYTGNYTITYNYTGN